jgi:hypothetical protein
MTNLDKERLDNIRQYIRLRQSEDNGYGRIKLFVHDAVLIDIYGNEYIGDNNIMDYYYKHTTWPVPSCSEPILEHDGSVTVNFTSFCLRTCKLTFQFKPDTALILRLIIEKTSWF